MESIFTIYNLIYQL